jgi:hypothetical protein
MDFCNIYTSKFFQKNSAISADAVFFIESLKFIKLKRLASINIQKYMLFSTYVYKLVVVLFMSCVIFLFLAC